MLKSRPRNTRTIQAGRKLTHAPSRSDNKQEWEKLYRAAVLESDRSKLAQRIEDAQAAILGREGRLAKRTAGHEKEYEAISRALHILSLLREVGPGL
jgi:hypothetical protein